MQISTKFSIGQTVRHKQRKDWFEIEQIHLRPAKNSTTDVAVEIFYVADKDTDWGLWNHDYPESELELVPEEELVQTNLKEYEQRKKRLLKQRDRIELELRQLEEEFPK